MLREPFHWKLNRINGLSHPRNKNRLTSRRVRSRPFRFTFLMGNYVPVKPMAHGNLWPHFPNDLIVVSLFLCLMCLCQIRHAANQNNSIDAHRTRSTIRRRPIQPYSSIRPSVHPSIYAAENRFWRKKLCSRCSSAAVFGVSLDLTLAHLFI